MLEKNKKQLSRRDVIKAAGLVSLGLMYTKPLVETIHAKPAFLDYGASKPHCDNGVGNGQDCLPPGNPPNNDDDPDDAPGNPGNRGGAN